MPDGETDGHQQEPMELGVDDECGLESDSPDELAHDSSEDNPAGAVPEVVQGEGEVRNPIWCKLAILLALGSLRARNKIKSVPLTS